MNEEIEILYRRFGSMVFRRCEALLVNEADAIDVTHDVFAKMLANDDLKISTPSSYLYIAATRQCLNKIRQQKSQKTELNDELLNSIAEFGNQESQSVAKDLLNRVFERNPETTQVIAVLHFIDGLTLDETATEVGMSVSGVRRRLRSLRGSLKKLLGES